MADQVKFAHKLKGSKVLIIGGSSGIGYAVAEAVLEYSGTAIISSSNPERVQQAVAKLQAAYPSAKDRISGHACNLGDEATIESNLQALFEKVGQLDHIVHTAGDALAMKTLDEIDIAFIKKAGCVRFFAPLLIGKLAPKYLRPGPASSFIITTGTVADRPMPGWAVVNSYATGLQGMTRALALDLKPIRVNLVCPGIVDTDLWAGMTSDEKQKVFEHWSGKLPTGKVATAEDIAESYIFLMRDPNTTGTQVSSNGGALLI